MSTSVFLDTNVFIYAFDSRFPAKQVAARNLVRQVMYDGSGVISYQVLQEFINAVTSKFSVPISRPDLEQYTTSVLWPMCRVFPSPALYSSAIATREKTGWTFYDGLIVAAALESECGVLYTEDLQDGRAFGPLEIRNPFR